MTVVDENRELVVKVKVLKSQGVIKSLTNRLFFLNFIVFLEECVM